jgi:hypothetical protein
MPNRRARLPPYLPFSSTVKALRAISRYHEQQPQFGVETEADIKGNNERTGKNSSGF